MAIESHQSLVVYEEVESRYPSIWRTADVVRAKFTKGAHLEGSIFTAAEAALVTKKICSNADKFIDPALVGALVAWRATKGIFKFNNALFESLIDTEIVGDVPSHILLKMPSWAVYVETPPTENMPYPIAGFWAYLSRQGRQNELILVAHFPRDTCEAEGVDFCDVLSYYLPIENLPLSELIEKNYSEWPDSERSVVVWFVSNMLSLLLYLCSEEPDIEGYTPPIPVVKLFGNKPRLIGAKEISAWEVGLRVGALLDFSKSDGANSLGVGDVQVRPHIRRAHWHSFWVGKRGEQTIKLKWLPPIAVNVNDYTQLPAVVRDVVRSD